MRRCLLLAFSLVVVACAVAPVSSAQAAAYSVWACADSQGNPLPPGDWSPSTVGSQVFVQTSCAVSGLGLAAGNLEAAAGRGPTQPDTSIDAGWTIAAAAGTTISGLDVWWTNSASVQAPGRVQIFAASRSLYSRDSGAFGNIGVPYGEPNHQSFTGLSAGTAALVAWCVTACAGPDKQLSALYNAYRLRTVVTDPAPPTGEVSGVSDGQIVSGPLSITARAGDAGSGVLDLQLVVDGQVIDSRASGKTTCKDIDPAHGDAYEYTSMKPCLAQLPEAGTPAATFTVTPAQLATAGPHNVSIVAHDAAGNAGTLSSSTVTVSPVLIDGPAPASRYDAARDLFFNPDAHPEVAAFPNGANAGAAKVTLSVPVKHRQRVKGRVRIVTRFVRSVTVGYSTAVRMRARLIGANGQPIIGARVYRATSVAGGPWELSTKPMLTSAHGRVSVKMPARAPSRRVQIIYFPSTDSNGNFRSPAALMAVRAPVSLSLTRRVVPLGGRVTVIARLGAGRRPSTSVIGALQVRKPAGWQTIRQLRFTSAPGGRGVARAALRFRAVPRGSTFRFRALVAAQASLRYAKGTSPTRVLRIG